MSTARGPSRAKDKVAGIRRRPLYRGPGGPSAGRRRRALETCSFASALFLSAFLVVYTTWGVLSFSLPTSGGGPLLVDCLKALAPCLFAALTFFIGARWTLLHVLAFASHRSQQRSPPELPERWPFVSVLVPACDEGKTIEWSLESLTRIDYPHYEVIVVDDGSRDDTFQRARRFQRRHGGCDVRVYCKPNGGKWSAHNMAFRHARGDLILCVDADSRLDPPALKRLVARLGDQRVAAVAGQVRVRNRVNLLARLQALEYLTCNGLVRMAQSLSGMVLVVPGPIGLFRRSVLEEVFRRYGKRSSLDDTGQVAGPFEGDTFAEDFDLSMAILSLGHRIVYEPTAISHTKAPEWIFKLLNQRYRWVRGSLQVLRKYFRRARSNPGMLKPGLVAWVLLTYVAEMLTLPLANLVTVTFIFAFLAKGGCVLTVLGWFLTFLLLQLHTGLLHASIHLDSLKTLAVVPFYHLYHVFLLNSGWVIAVIDEIRRSRMRW